MSAKKPLLPPQLIVYAIFSLDLVPRQAPIVIFIVNLSSEYTGNSEEIPL
jgi:hypothetical protein